MMERRLLQVLASVMIVRAASDQDVMDVFLNENCFDVFTKCYCEKLMNASQTQSIISTNVIGQNSSMMINSTVTVNSTALVFTITTEMYNAATSPFFASWNYSHSNGTCICCSIYTESFCMWLEKNINTVDTKTVMVNTTTIIVKNIREMDSTTTITITTITTASTTSTQCQNGGYTYNGFCICPDNYTGNYCETLNICPAQQYKSETYTFPQTISGQSSYSTEMCPPDTPNGGFPTATARCVNGIFSTPTALNCSLVLDVINKDLQLPTATAEVQHKLAFSAQILTSRPKNLTSANISSAARISSYLLSLTNISQDIKVAAVTTVSQLLEADRQMFSKVNPGSIASLTQTLTNFSLNVNESLVQPNIAIYSAKGPSDVNMTVFADPQNSSNYNLSPNRIKLNVSSSPADVISAHVSFKFFSNLSGSSGNEDNDIGIVLYNNDKFFKSNVFKDFPDRKVISGKLKNIVEFIQFTMKREKNQRDFACVTWDYTQSDWTTEGCTKIQNTTCQCNEQKDSANFAMFMSCSSSYTYSLELSMISKIGSYLSLAGVVVTTVFQILTRKSRKTNATFLIVNICSCLIVVYIIFIFGINNPNNPSLSLAVTENQILPSYVYENTDQGPCTAVTALLHYFLLATFTWSTLYGTYIFFMIKSAPAGPPSNYILFSTMLGWGLPAIIVLETFGIVYQTDDPLRYRREEFCWLSGDGMNPILWGFLLPITVMIFVNVNIFFYFASTICRPNPALNCSVVPTLQKKMISCISMSVVLGLSWISGFFMLTATNPIFNKILSFIFCLCSSTQGIQIFLFFTLRTSFFKEKSRAVLKFIPHPVLAFHRKYFEL